MKSLNDLFDLIKQSDVTLIGYTFQDEKIKDELISNFNYIDVVEIDSSFSFKSFLRNIKLNSILQILDFFYVNIFQMSKILQVKSCSGFPGKPQFKIILTTSLYKIVDISF